ncbi:hypothetical protein KCU88_g176, partial [Aureobasidium melanogenum]
MNASSVIDTATVKAQKGRSSGAVARLLGKAKKIQILQKVMRIARGMARRGFCASPTVTPTISVPRRGYTQQPCERGCRLLEACGVPDPHSEIIDNHHEKPEDGYEDPGIHMRGG